MRFIGELPFVEGMLHRRTAGPFRVFIDETSPSDGPRWGSPRYTIGKENFKSGGVI